MKIGGREFQGNVFLAPMAGFTDPPFRLSVQRFGVSALWTEMISAHAMVMGAKPQLTADLEGHQVPTIFQLFGSDPSVIAKAATIAVDLGAAAIDVNMGCPVRKVVSKGAGAALMKDLRLSGQVVAAVRKAISVPLSVKIRTGWDQQTTNAAQVSAVVEQEGADVVVVHCRTRTQGHSGPPNLDVLAEVKGNVRIPVIGNGGITTTDEALSMMSRTGCDGVMIGRGALGRPWFPGKTLRTLSGLKTGFGRATTVFEVIRDQFRRQLKRQDALTAVRRMRKHLVWYSRGFTGSAKFRARVLRMEDPDLIIEEIRRFFGKAVIL